MNNTPEDVKQVFNRANGWVNIDREIKGRSVAWSVAAYAGNAFLPKPEGDFIRKINRRHRLAILLGVFNWTVVLTPVSIVRTTHAQLSASGFYTWECSSLHVFGLRIARWVRGEVRQFEWARAMAAPKETEKSSDADQQR